MLDLDKKMVERIERMMMGLMEVMGVMMMVDNWMVDNWMVDN
jgi:hypothetical protein